MIYGCNYERNNIPVDILQKASNKDDTDIQMPPTMNIFQKKTLKLQRIILRQVFL